MSVEIVRLDKVTVEYDGVPAIKDHTLTINENDVIGIIGPNGGGKTTLLKVILGLVQPSQGTVRVFGGTPQKNRRYIGYVPQIAALNHDFPITVWETVLMGRLTQRPPLHAYTAEDESAASAALDAVEMSHRKDRAIGALSGGERQRVLIARALAGEPKLLLLDEPAASIDPQVKTSIYELIKDLRKKMAVLLVTHDVGVVSTYVDTIACLNCQLYYHGSKEISPETMDAIYGCPVDLIAHGVPHRVLHKHS